MSSEVLAGRYRLLSLLGRGGAGEVWRAEDLVLRRPVAVKLMRRLDGDPVRSMERFRSEAWAAARLSHPHVVVTYDVGAEAGQVFLVMELVNGSDLAELLRTGRRPAAEQVADIAVQAARALDAAHAAGIVHRDVKPGNLLLARDGTLKIADFGIAQAATALEPGGVALLGTPAYVSPEQARGEPATSASDRYALGCVLYELLTGSPPFTGEAGEVLRMHRDAAPEPVLQRRPDITPGLAELVTRLLSKDPARRPASASEVVALLEAEHEHTRVLAVPEPQRRESLPYLRVAAVLAVVLAVVGAVALLRDATSGEAARPSPTRPAAPTTKPTTAKPTTAQPTKTPTTKRPTSTDPVAALTRLASLLRDGKAGRQAAKDLDRAAAELADGNVEDAASRFHRVTRRLADAWQDGRWQPTPEITALLTYLGRTLPDTGDEGENQE